VRCAQAKQPNGFSSSTLFVVFFSTFCFFFKRKNKGLLLGYESLFFPLYFPPLAFLIFLFFFNKSAKPLFLSFFYVF